jgi:hypothetical protein
MALESMLMKYQNMGRKHKALAFRLSRLSNKVRDKTLNQFFEYRKKSFLVIFHKWFQLIKKAEEHTAKAGGRPGTKSFNKLDHKLVNKQASSNRDKERPVGMVRKGSSATTLSVLKLSQAARYTVKPSFEYKLDNDKIIEMILAAVNRNELY